MLVKLVIVANTER